MGDKQNQPFQRSLNASLKIDFQGSRVTSDGGLILVRELDERLGFGSEKIWERGAALTSRLQSFETEMLAEEQNFAGLTRINRELIAKAETIDSPQRVVLDMDNTEIPVYGQQENSAYNGHFESTCYHPLLLFNREGDCLAGKQTGERKEGDGEVYEKSLEMRHFRVSTYSEEAGLAPSWVAGVAREGNNKRTASTEAIGCTIEGGQDAKTEILDEYLPGTNSEERGSRIPFLMGPHQGGRVS